MYKHINNHTTDKHCNLPAYVDTRCRRHTERPARRHKPQMQQTPGTHWETLSLREGDRKHIERTALVQFLRFEKFTFWIPQVCVLELKVQTATKLLTSGVNALLLSIHPRHLASATSEPRREMYQEWGGKWHKGSEAASCSCSLHVSMGDVHMSGRDNTMGPEAMQLPASAFLSSIS